MEVGKAAGLDRCIEEFLKNGKKFLYLNEIEDSSDLE